MPKSTGSKQPGLVIKHHQPMRRVIWFAGGMLGIILMWLLGFLFGQQYQREQQVALQDEGVSREQLEVRIAELAQDRLVNQVALDSARASLSEKEQQISQLAREIAFYRGVMAPEEGKRGLRIERFSVNATDDESVFNLRWSLVQAGKSTRHITGEVAVELVGTQAGRKKVLSLNQVVRATPDLNFKFRYFQNFSVQVELPGDFIVEKVSVSAVSQDKQPQSVARQFDWLTQEMLVDVE